MSIAPLKLAESLAYQNIETSLDPTDLAFYAQDLVCRGADLAAVVRPRDKFQLAKAVSIVTATGHPVVPRGGGMSYTGGYTPDGPGAVVFDLSRMNRVIEIDRENMHVTVEAGCTWATLWEQLSPHGLRTPMWGTLSGLKATVGGTMSQNGIFWGTARHGTAAHACTALEVVLADGTLLSLGKTHLRPYGPDLIGLFLADCGAMGVKATITMRLLRESPSKACASFAFEGRDSWLSAAAEIQRQGIATECFGFDPHLNAIRMERESLARDARQLIGMMRQQGSLMGAVRESARVVIAGRKFLDRCAYSLHVLSEGRVQPAADADIAAARTIVTDFGGTEIENTIPKMIRANPFGPLNAILGPRGERWAPIHGHLPHARAIACLAAIEQLFEDNAGAMNERGIHFGTLVAVIAGGTTVIEPCLYWPDARSALAERTVERGHLKKVPILAHDPETRALAEGLRQVLVDLFFAFGAAHFQIGRTYRYREGLQPAGDDLLKAIKRQVDPRGLMNPGVLAL